MNPGVYTPQPRSVAEVDTPFVGDGQHEASSIMWLLRHVWARRPKEGALVSSITWAHRVGTVNVVVRGPRLVRALAVGFIVDDMVR